MKSIILVVVAMTALAAGLPKPQANLVPGVFISADAFKRLQEQANANRQNQPASNPEPVQSGQIIALNQPANLPVMTNQPAVNSQVPTNNGQSQPTISSQSSSGQAIYVLQQQPAQSGVVQPQKQATSVVVSTSNPSGQQSTSGPAYTLVQSGGNTYLIPLSSSSSNPIILSAASS